MNYEKCETLKNETEKQIQVPPLLAWTPTLGNNGQYNIRGWLKQNNAGFSSACGEYYWYNMRLIFSTCVLQGMFFHIKFFCNFLHLRNSLELTSDKLAIFHFELSCADD